MRCPAIGCVRMLADHSLAIACFECSRPERLKICDVSRDEGVSEYIISELDRLPAAKSSPDKVLLAAWLKKNCVGFKPLAWRTPRDG